MRDLPVIHCRCSINARDSVEIVPIGVCQPFGNDSPGAVEKVSWSFDKAPGEGAAKIITTYGDEYNGAVIGMRPHNEWFKFSIRFTDIFDKQNDLTVFHAVGDYRMGLVSFNLVDGEKYVSLISAFEVA